MCVCVSVCVCVCLAMHKHRKVLHNTIWFKQYHNYAFNVCVCVCIRVYVCILRVHTCVRMYDHLCTLYILYVCFLNESLNLLTHRFLDIFFILLTTAKL